MEPLAEHTSNAASLVQVGDSLYFRQYQNNAQGGLIVYFSDGSAAQWGVLDTDGQGLNNDTVRGQWHSRSVPLDGSNGNPSYVGKTLTTVLAVNDVAAPDGAFDMYFTDMAVVNGSTAAASAVFNAAPAQAVSSWSIFGGSSVTGVAAAIEAGTTDPSGGSAATTHYYLDDHLGTAQAELNAWGLPMWQGQFTPFGTELPDGSTTMHYKFTGKERDAESGLDNFGARYYASTTGRWMSPDWAAKPEAVPYSSLADPQSLNLYNYVGNNPLSKADADGHDYLHMCSGAEQGAGTCSGGSVSLESGDPPQQAQRQPQQQQQAQQQ